MAAESSSYVTLETLVCTFIWQKKGERERKKERKEKTPKDRTKYVALQITATPRWKHSCVRVIECLYNISFIIFR